MFSRILFTLIRVASMVALTAGIGQAWTRREREVRFAAAGGLELSSLGYSGAILGQAAVIGAIRAEDKRVDSASLHPFESSLSTVQVQVVGNYPHYGEDKLSISDIPYDKLSHIGYFALSPTANGDLDASDISVVSLQELVTHADANDVTTFITVGGWDASEHFSVMSGDPSARLNFAASLAQYCLDHNLDGADLDWEPVLSDTDKTNYSLLIKNVHDEFEPLGLMLTISVSAYGDEITQEAIGLVDWLNIMAYDDIAPHHSTFDLAVSSLAHWEKKGASRGKQVLGVPFYGRHANRRSYTYKYIVDRYHPEPHVDYVAGIGFNGIETIKRKTKYVIDNGYRGLMIWELSQDATDDSSLLNAIRATIVETSPADFNGNGHVGLDDFSVLASVWQSHPDDDNWNPLCDISRPRDNVVDGHDLSAFCEYWSAGL